LLTKEDRLPPFDFYAPLLSLPGILNTTLKTIPVNIPYLLIADHIVSPIVTQSKALNIGIVWAGRPTHKNDKNRSINLSFFSAITNIHDTQFYSLQVGDQRADLNQEAFASQIIDVGKHLGDYAETATVINQLDLIITVDTSVAHLAGAMGKPVWVLLPFAPDWRWLLERDDSPWYPTMRLFRQQERGNWTTVFNEVNQALEVYRMTISRDLDLSEVLSSTINALKAGNISEGNEKLTDLLGLLDSTTGEIPEEKILALKPLLNESLNRLKNRDYLGVADILEKDVTSLLDLHLSDPTNEPVPQLNTSKTAFKPLINTDKGFNAVIKCKESKERLQMKLNLGCGHNKVNGYLNVDMSSECQPDLECDLEILPWVWADNSVDAVTLP